MPDRRLEKTYDEVPPIPEILEKVLVYVLEEAREKMEQGDEVVPTSALVVKENLFLETHPGDTVDACFEEARHTVARARGADAYAFCYDGYIDTDDGMKDALIAEGGVPGAPTGYAVCYLYELDKANCPLFEEEIAFIGDAPNFMEGLKAAEEYADEEIESRYLEVEDAGIPEDADIPEKADDFGEVESVEGDGEEENL